MALFGSFETEREVYSNPIYTVYSARKAGDAKIEYAIKVFSIQQVGFDPETTTELAPLLVDIESSRTQSIGIQEKTAGGSRFIAPVLEKGQDERGVWYTTKFYPRSVNKIIIGKVLLTRDALQHVIGSMAQGALDFKRTCGRSHGDILPSNVQISRSERLSEAEVVLSDPVPGGDEEAVDFEINDLHRIGRILLQLVLQRSIRNEDDFLILPILSSAEWTDLFDKDAETWLSLCNRLLNPNLSLDQLSLESLVAELAQLEPKAAVSSKLVMVGGLALFCVAAIVLLLLIPKAQEIQVTSDPPGATILVDDEAQQQTAPLNLTLRKGRHVIEARHEQLGLEAQTTNFQVKRGAAIKLHFPFAYGTVSLDSDPSGARVWIGTNIIGSTPTSILRPVGETTFRFELTGFLTTNVTVKVANNSRPAIRQRLARPGLGR